jgi:WD40 repeat protein/serine/threonine protein kinase
MSDELHDERIAELFALTKGLSAEDQAHFLDEECRNDPPEVRQRVEKLLAADRQLHATVDVPPPNSTTDTPVSRKIGQFKLLQRIGEGGMGEVWMAEQRLPVRRRVALKLIRSDSPSREIIARFEAERQALAMMDHPNIAKVLDLGQTESGQPYFVMDLVQGVPITNYCDSKKLTPRERLELFVPVCHAIQHAHQKGIIHRDIKPSNVLVTLYDGKPVAKVIDFGLAKALQTQTQLTDKTLFTEFGRVVGTLQYMSPEQAELNALDVDTRTDVYSLGVMLYELLTGSTPLEHETIRQKAMLAVLQMIREQEPPRPSKRFSDSGEAITGISAQRRINPAQLSRLLKGDLDWIAMKALEKDRTRRYATAASLSEDVQRYLDNEPVQARPPSFRYRFGKLARKHRAAVLAGSAVFASLIFGIVATSSIAKWALSERARADKAAAEALVEKTRADTRTEEALAEKERAKLEKARADEKATEAVAEKSRAEKQLTRSELLLYVSQISAAQRDWEINDVHGAWRNLNACRQDLRGWEHDYLFTLFTNQTTLAGHLEPIWSVAFSLDGKWIASGSENGTLQVLDVVTKQEVANLKTNDFRLRSVAFSPDGNRVASSSEDGNIRIWDIDGEKELIYESHENAIINVAFNTEGSQFLTVSRDGQVKVRDIFTAKQLRSLNIDSNVVLSCDFSHDGKRVVTSSGDSLVRKLLARSPEIDSDKTPVANEDSVTVWDAENGKEIRSFKGDASGARPVAISDDGTRVVCIGPNRSIICSTENDEEVRLVIDTGLLWDVAFSPDGNRIVGGRDDGTVKIWDAASGEEVRTFKGHLGPVLSVAFSPDGNEILSGSADGTLKLWEATTNSEGLTIQGHGSQVTSLAFTTDGKRFVSGGAEHPLNVWDTKSGQKVLTLKGHTVGIHDALTSVCFSPDGKWIVSCGGDNAVKVWNSTSGNEVLALKGHLAKPTSATFSPDGKWIASGSLDGTLKVWDATNGHALRTLLGHNDGVWNVTFSADGKRIVSAGADETLKVWDATSGQQLRSMKGHKLGVSSVVVSHDGKQIVSAGGDDTVRIWDTESGRQVLEFKGHAEGVWHIAHSSDKRRIVTAWGNTLKIWDATSGQELLTLKGHMSDVTSVAFSPLGNLLVSGSADGMIKIWDASRHQDLPSDQYRQ